MCRGSACTLHMFLSCRAESLCPWSVLSLVWLWTSLFQFHSGSKNFSPGFVQSFCFVTTLASKTIVERGTSLIILASLERESASSFPSVSTWARIHWKIQDFLIVSMESRRELISWMSLIFLPWMVSRVYLLSEKTMMPSEWTIFVHLRHTSWAGIEIRSSLLGANGT